jgi:hypothetical protein
MSDTEALADAFHVIEVWYERLVTGSPQQITDFIREAERVLPSGWQRDHKREERFITLPDEPVPPCFVRTSRPGVGVTLWLDREGGTLLLPGTDRSMAGSQYYLELAEAIREFESAVLFPAASVSGAKVTSRVIGPRSVVPGLVMDYLFEFLGTGRRDWPLPVDVAKKWRRLVISAYRSDTLLEPAEFREWLVAQGWSDEQAQRFLDELDEDAQLLADFKDELKIT